MNLRINAKIKRVLKSLDLIWTMCYTSLICVTLSHSPTQSTRSGVANELTSMIKTKRPSFTPIPHVGIVSLLICVLGSIVNIIMETCMITKEERELWP